MDTTNVAVKAAGYQAMTVAQRIIDMDVDAIGNGDKAAWKRYLTLALLAMAKNVDKKKLIETVFGKGAKPSKTFQNMWSMAEKARGYVLGNRDWADIAAMTIDEAVSNVLLSINSHMSQLNVSSKNDYDMVCNKSVSEAAQFFTSKAEAAAQAKAEAEAKAATDKEEGKAKEAEAQANAAATPERTPSEAAIAALHGASHEELGLVAMHIFKNVPVDMLQAMHEGLEALIALQAKAVAAPEAKAA